MRQFAGFGTPEDTNARYKALLAAGGTGLSVAFDLPTLMGRDPDHPLSLGEVGEVRRQRSSSLADMEAAVRRHPARPTVTTSMTINSPAAMLFAMYLVVAERQGVAWTTLSGTLQNDILEGVHRAEGVHLPAAAVDAAGHRHLRLLRRADVPRWQHDLGQRLPHPRGRTRRRRRSWRSRCATASSTCSGASTPGSTVDEFAPRLVVLLQRAQRLLRGDRQVPRRPPASGPRVMRERFGARRTSARWKLRFHTQTAGVSLTAQQPYNNVVRTALQALSAVLGGTNSLHTNSLDEALRAAHRGRRPRWRCARSRCWPTRAGVTDVVDPFGGSLLRRGADRRRWRAEALAYFDRRSTRAAAWWRPSKPGFPSARSPESSTALQRALEASARSWSASTTIVNEAGSRGAARHPGRSTRRRRRRRSERLAALKQRRDGAAVAEALGLLARGGRNVRRISCR